ncbi:hypothetical protein COOONC_03610 [Cooperia oncophora]
MSVTEDSTGNESHLHTNAHSSRNVGHSRFRSVGIRLEQIRSEELLQAQSSVLSQKPAQQPPPPPFYYDPFGPPPFHRPFGPPPPPPYFGHYGLYNHGARRGAHHGALIGAIIGAAAGAGGR